MPSLPTELLFEIYSYLFPSASRDPHESCFLNAPKDVDLQKPRWCDIRNITLVSKQSREIALSLWFHTIRIDDDEIWKDPHWEILPLAYKCARYVLNFVLASSHLHGLDDFLF